MAGWKTRPPFNTTFNPTKIKYFKDTDTAFIQLLDKPVFETREISDNVLIDINEEGNLVSMTVEHAKEKAGSWEFSYQEIAKKTA